MKIISLDLELNQPSGKIIEIGAVAGNLATGEIESIWSSLVDPGELLDPRITELTGITQNSIIGAPDLISAGSDFIAWAQKHKEFPNLMTWGGNDSQMLKEQMGSSISKWPFGYRHLDVKTVYVAYQHSLGNWTPRSGLAKSMSKLGLAFRGTKHGALSDAYSTFYFYYNLLRLIRGEKIDTSPLVPKEVLKQRNQQK